MLEQLRIDRYVLDRLQGSPPLSTANGDAGLPA